MSASSVRRERHPSTFVRRLQGLGFDPYMLLVVAIMVAYGLVMTYSSSWEISWRLYSDPDAIFRRQLTNLGIGLGIMLMLAQFPLKWWRTLALPLMVFTIFALAAVLLLAVGGGPKRSFLSGSVQPSELAKLALIIYLAVWMESKQDRLKDWGYGLIPLMIIIGIVSGLILLQPDLSAALTVGVVALVMFVLAGSKLMQTLLIMVGSSLIGYLLVRVNTTGQARWEAFIAGLVDIEQASYHVQHALQAFHAGGLIGRGLGASREKFGALPAPHTDSVFAVVGEELGLLGALLVLTLFLLFLWRGFRIAMQSKSSLAMLLASGITFWIGTEALINMSVLLGLLPFAGNALPLFSYGGSSLVATLTGIGLILSASRRVPEGAEEDVQIATLDIGGGHRRGRVSRLGSGRVPGRQG